MTSWGPFHRHAQRYDAWFGGPTGSVLFPAEVEALRLLAGHLSPPFLEVGVGTGAFAQALNIALGVDPAPGALRRAAGRGIEVVRAVGEALPFREGAFGGVFFINTFCFVPDPTAVLREALRVVRPGGGLVVAEVEKESPWGRFYGQKKAQGHLFYRHASFYSLAEIKAMFHLAGLRVEGSSCTLLQPPADPPKPEKAQSGIVPGASFVCLLGRKARA